MSTRTVTKKSFTVLPSPIAASIKRVFMPPDDPCTEYKRRVFEALGMKCSDLPENAADCRGGLLELSSLSVLPDKFQDLVINAKAALIAPELDGVGSIMAGMDAADRKKIIPALPMRYWSMIESVREFMKNNSGGEMVSFRICMNLPQSRKGMFGDFSKSFFPQVIDIACLIAGGKPEKIQIKRTPKFNSAFGIVRFPCNIIAELDVNECLSDSMDPIRFIHVYCQEGAISNLPFGGYTNVEGALVATAAGVARPVYEHNIWDGCDELDNFYFRMIYKIRNGESLSVPGVTFGRLVKAAAAAARADFVTLDGGAA